MNDNAKKDNRGYLYPNTNKNKPTQPDMTGKLFKDGKEYRLSGWHNKSSDGTQYISITVSLPFNPGEHQGGNQGNYSNSNNSSSHSGQANAGKSGSYSNGAPISDDLDIDAILNQPDDDNPFGS